MVGLVLAGGDGVRFGRPKASVRFGAETLAERACRVLTDAGLRVALASGPHDPRASTEALSVARLPDAEPERGPLGGLVAGFRWAGAAGAEAAFVLSCDLPLVPATAVRSMLAQWRARPPGCLVLMATTAFPAPRIQPLCAVYGAATWELAERRLSTGRLAVRDLALSVAHMFAGPETWTGTQGPETALLNVNHPDDLARALAAASGSEPEPRP